MAAGKKLCPHCAGSGYVNDPNFAAQRIQTLRKQKKLTLEALSRRSGIVVSTLKNLEEGKYTPLMFAHVLKLSRALGVDLNAFAMEQPPHRPRSRRR